MKRHHDKLISHYREVQDAIDTRGYSTTAVLDDQFQPGFAYTIGFLIRGHPEVMTLGLDGEKSHHLFFHIDEDLRAGITHPIGRDQPFALCDATVCLLPVPVEHWVGRHCLLLGIDRYYEVHPNHLRPDGVVQLVWADPDGSFPWDVGCDEAVYRDQPILIDGDAPERRWPLDHPIDNDLRCPYCRAEAEMRRARFAGRHHPETEVAIDDRDLRLSGRATTFA